jgi:hypothetical protein
MFANKVGARGATRAVAEVEPPTGGVPSIAGTRKPSCEAEYFCSLATFFIRKVWFNTPPQICALALFAPPTKIWY